MDRAEGALLVAQKALQETRAVALILDEIKAAPKGAVSFLVNDSGALVAIYADGEAKTIGCVRGASGQHGTSVVSASIEDGMLKLGLSDGSTIEAGSAQGDPGPAGKDADPAVIKSAVESGFQVLAAEFVQGLAE